MKVILKEDIDNLGKKGDIKEVSGGYARNFLMPKGLVELATGAKISYANKLKKQREEEDAKKIKELEKIAAGIRGIKIKITEKAKDDGKLFGSIKAERIIEELNKKAKAEFSKEMVILDEPIRKVGDYKIKIKISQDIETEIELKVEKEKK